MNKSRRGLISSKPWSWTNDHLWSNQTSLISMLECQQFSRGRQMKMGRVMPALSSRSKEHLSLLRIKDLRITYHFWCKRVARQHTLFTCNSQIKSSVRRSMSRIWGCSRRIYRESRQPGMTPWLKSIILWTIITRAQPSIFLRLVRTTWIDLMFKMMIAWITQLRG